MRQAPRPAASLVRQDGTYANRLDDAGANSVRYRRFGAAAVVRVRGYFLWAKGRSRSLSASLRPRSRLAFIQFFTASV